ncbi:unknown protein (plasmid) [Synechocystis sp. PCC 6803]|uniref:Uncharacterized protein n=2 Tax=Synechocystis TaxID=1142 RepID=Q6ZEA0_SYNY3|nr:MULTISPECIES: hypothetical protein [unclassified Synechocystis]MBD2618870.1 hypothetical protein [Synechocystis sp. FACHB-898]AGF53652.1 hypothetical protein MYO_4960 [Synechocystis sp. PCC 6803]AVP91501.1 hypothetical protein C7I86_17165 [Synechocystis sp. IPPAS B-1465]MBD2637362.1 hypothetical protein [Synechocystis sp. FACHB-908]MBD2661620.1 hypothetical protein [Synechocystis sp. FACHB-929]
MYDALLPIVMDSYGQNSRCMPSFLSGLQPAVKELRQRYRTNNVQVDYGQPQIQAAYLLTYYPYYVQQTHHNLSLASQHHHVAHLLRQRNLQVTLLGSGPMPEAAALATYRQKLQFASSLKAISYDLNVHQWRSACQITARLMADLAPNITYKYEGHPLNLAQHHALFPAQWNIQNSQLIIIQNCLNEIYRANLGAFKQNMQFLMNNMAPGSALLLSDLDYHQTSRCLQLLKQLADATPGITTVFDHGDRLLKYENSFSLPFSIRRHLLTGQNGLIPKKWIRQFSLCLLKQ